MSNIYSPKTIVLDSSTINNIANDYVNNKKRKLALETISFINDNHLIPVILFEHIEEICQGADFESSKRSLELIGKFNNVYWINNIKATGFLIGSVKDIIKAEVNLVIESPKTNYKELIQNVSKRVFSFGTGTSFLDKYYDTWIALRSYFQNGVERKKEISSILNVDFGLSRDTKLKDIRNNELYSPEKAAKNLITQKKRISEQLKTKGDPDLINPENTTNGFHNLLVEDFSIITNEGQPNSIEDLASRFGISDDELNTCKTIGDICDLAVFKKQFEILGDGAKSFRKDGSKIMPKDIPSWNLIHSLAELCRKGKKRADGGDIIDCDISVMSLYCDYLIVDKRTHHFLEQISKVNAFKGLINKFLKLSFHLELKDKIFLS